MDVSQPPHGRPDELGLAALVARRHLVDGQSKVEIAEELGLSRFKVARLVEQAHRAGLVHIEVRDPGGTEVVLAHELRECLGLRHAAVVAVPPLAEDARRAVGAAAARLLGQVLKPGDVLGLPWSRGVHDMVNALESLGLSLPPVPVVQLSGALARGADDSSTVDLVRRAARVLQGGRYMFFAPLIMPDAASAATIRREPSVRSTLAAADDVTVAVVGVGAWAPHESSVHDAVERDTRRDVADAGVIGDAAGLTFDGSGTLVRTALADRVVTLSPDQLEAVEEVIGIAYGRGKVQAIRAVARSGLITSLVTTTETAELILADERDGGAEPTSAEQQD